jgi:bifunctional DNA-binding transcriptional regulator/antitoxin component of YhaV-PrlF toxin-antitoxin module
MQKLSKQIYYNKDGVKVINCYRVYLSKETVKKANITEDDKLIIYAKNGKIIIEKDYQ